MKQIEEKLNDFKQAVKNGLINGTIKYTKRYIYNSATPYVDWCEVEFTIGETKLSLSVGKYKRDIFSTKAGSIIISMHNDLLKGMFTEEEEQQFCEIVDNKPMEQHEIDEEIEYYEQKLKELKHE